jgi:hypothetical protein
VLVPFLLAFMQPLGCMQFGLTECVMTMKLMLAVRVIELSSESLSARLVIDR